MELAGFNAFNNMDGGNAQFTGTHQIKELNNAAKGVVAFNDHKDGQFSTVGKTNNIGQMSISGNHAFDQFANQGKVAVIPRAFNEKGEPVALMELSQFNAFNNMDGGNAQFTGTHMVKEMNNAAKGVVAFNDHKDGQFSTIGKTNNIGQMSISGNHAFDQFANSGKVAVIPRGFNEKGEPVKLNLLI